MNLIWLARLKQEMSKENMPLFVMKIMKCRIFSINNTSTTIPSKLFLTRQSISSKFLSPPCCTSESINLSCTSQLWITSKYISKKYSS